MPAARRMFPVRSRKGEGEASRLEREDLPIGVVHLEGADIPHVTILSGYGPYRDQPGRHA